MSETGNSVLQGRQLLFQRSKKRAFDCLQKNEFSRAYAHFIVALTIEPDDEEMMNSMLYTLSMLSNELEIQENWNELFMCYQQILELFPHSAQVLHGLATVLFRLGHVQSATDYFQKAFRENPFYTPALYCADNIKNALVERWHFAMLNDKKRNAAFAQAIRQAVKDGYKSVLDIGAGTGILSMIAADAGAEKVCACEGSQVMFEIMQNVVEANKKNIILLNKLSYHLNIPSDLPERVNLVVTEIFDAGLFGEDILQTLSHAWDHLLKENTSICQADSSAISHNALLSPPSKVIPQSANIWAVPITCPAIRKETVASAKSLSALDLSDGGTTYASCSDEPYSTERLIAVEGGYVPLCAPKKIATVDFNNVQEIKNHLNGKLLSVEYTCIAKGRIDAVAVWFDLHLDEHISLSTEPENTESCWEQAIFCVNKNLQGSSPFVDHGDIIEIDFLCKGHLILQRVATSTVASLPKFVTFQQPIIQTLNSLSYSGVLHLNLLSKVLLKEPLVVDISSIPVIGLKLLKDGAKKLVTLPSKSLMGTNLLLQLCSIPKEKVQVMSYEDICLESLSCDVLVTEPVDFCGLLKKNIFEDVALIRTFCRADPVIYPSKLVIHASLIESSNICAYGKIVSDNNCLGYKISEFLNTYKSNIHQDLQLSTLPHVSLCEDIKLCEIDLSKLLVEKNKLQSFVEFHGTTKAKITKTGSITAVPYWFYLVYDSDAVINTRDPDSLWKQAAIILDSMIDVHEGETVCVTWKCRNSCLHISVEKTETS